MMRFQDWVMLNKHCRDHGHSNEKVLDGYENDAVSMLAAMHYVMGLPTDQLKNYVITAAVHFLNMSMEDTYPGEKGGAA